jgi:hypothetical protein
MKIQFYKQVFDFGDANDYKAPYLSDDLEFLFVSLLRKFDSFIRFRKKHLVKSIFSLRNTKLQQIPVYTLTKYLIRR